MRQKNKYLGLTIGPIYKSFSNVRHTRELWAASFCFSYVMRAILNNLINDNIISNRDIILPYVENNELFKKTGIGLFPDRIILKASNNRLSQDILDQYVEKAIIELAECICLYLGTSATIQDVVKYLTDYFQISYIEKDYDQPLVNPIIELSPYLDSLEQFTKYIAVEGKRNYLFEFFNEVNRKDNTIGSFLKKYYEIKDINGNIRVESLIEVASRELKHEKEYKPFINKYLWDKDQQKDREDKNPSSKKESTDSLFIQKLIESIKDEYKSDIKKKNPFRTYHKYVCILKADGDKMGAYLRSLSTEVEVQKLSQKLMTWAEDTYSIVKEYGGIPIFIGGDDLLCIVPVCNGESNIFSVIKEIDHAFNQQFEGTQATLSYGVSISHYKYPLSETLEISDKLLREAKDTGGNRIAVQLLKHSGSELRAILDKQNKTYTETIKHLLDLLDKYSGEKELKSVINNSVLYTIRDNHPILENIISDPERLVYFINNNFDVKAEQSETYDVIPVRKKDDQTDFYDDPLKEQYFFSLKEMINLVFKSKKADKLVERNKEELVAETLKEVFSTFRIVKFVKGYEDDKE